MKPTNFSSALRENYRNKHYTFLLTFELNRNSVAASQIGPTNERSLRRSGVRSFGVMLCSTSAREAWLVPTDACECL